LKSFLKRITPEFVRLLYRGLRDTRYRMRRTYSGVYPTLEAVPVAGTGYEDQDWPTAAAQYARWAIAENESGFIPAAVVNDMAYLPLVVALTGAKRILDFGGATGFSYIATKYGALREIERYVVVEHANVCVQGRVLFKDDKRIAFLEAIPQEKFDIAVVGSALQYVKDYKALLRQLTETGPRCILLTKLPAGDNATFATLQVNLTGKTFATWLFNAQEIVAAMEQLNYRLAFRSALEGQINQGDVAPEHRLQRFCNLLFISNSEP
jgi:putative methyltransferase (TIGR04325 family)